MGLKRIVQMLGLLYLALWTFSTGYRAWRGFEHSAPEDVRFVDLQINGSAVPQGSIRLAYREFNIESSETP